MKLLMALLLISGMAHGQDRKKVLEWKVNSDTFEIALPLAIHYIKIGTQVYQIKEHEPTIELAPKPINPWWNQNLYSLPNNGFQTIPVNTLYGQWGTGTSTLDSLISHKTKK